MPSASMTRVPVSRASSSSRDRSALERASREISSPKTAPASPSAHPAQQLPEPFTVGGRAADRPRSQSITSMRPGAQPSRAASPASPYCRAVDSLCSRTCISVDWRT